MNFHQNNNTSSNGGSKKFITKFVSIKKSSGKALGVHAGGKLFYENEVDRVGDLLRLMEIVEKANEKVDINFLFCNVPDNKSDSGERVVASWVADQSEWVVADYGVPVNQPLSDVAQF